MSGKRSLPSIWAWRGALFAAVAASSLVLVAAVGAMLLLSPPEHGASTVGGGLSGGTTPVPSLGPEDVGHGEVLQRTDRGSEPPRAVATVPPSTGGTRPLGSLPSPGEPGSPSPRSADVSGSPTPHPGGGPSTADPGGPASATPGAPTQATSTPADPAAPVTPVTPVTPPATPPGWGHGCGGPGKKHAPVVEQGKKSPVSTQPCGKPKHPHPAP